MFHTNLQNNNCAMFWGYLQTRKTLFGNCWPYPPLLWSIDHTHFLVWVVINRQNPPHLFNVSSWFFGCSDCTQIFLSQDCCNISIPNREHIFQYLLKTRRFLSFNWFLIWQGLTKSTSNIEIYILCTRFNKAQRKKNLLPRLWFIQISKRLLGMRVLGYFLYVQ